MENNIIWKGESHPEYEDLIAVELEKKGFDGEKSKKMIYHVILLGEDYDGPSIILLGDEHNTDVIAEYLEETKWVTIKDGKPAESGDTCALTGYVEEIVKFEGKEG